MENIKRCELCGQDTSFERTTDDLPPEGARAGCCDTWVCEDCVCWNSSGYEKADIVCKDCCKCTC